MIFVLVLYKNQDCINLVVKELYSKDIFLEYDIELLFIQAEKSVYKQFSDEFVPFLSMIDILMFNDITDLHQQLHHFILL